MLNSVYYTLEEAEVHKKNHSGKIPRMEREMLPKALEL